MEQRHTNLLLFEESEDTLSLHDLPLHYDKSSHQDPNPSSDEGLFEFFTRSTTRTVPTDTDILFSEDTNPFKETNESRKRNRARESLTESRFSLSHSCRTPGPGMERCELPGMRKLPTARSRKHYFVFGLAKFPPQMELSDIRKRQSRPLTAPIASDERGKRAHRALVGPLRCKAHIVNALSKASLGCIPYM